MRTRSRQSTDGGGKPAEEKEAPVALPLKSPRSSKKRQAPDTTSATPPASERKKSKGVVATTAVAAAVVTPPPTAGKRKNESLEELPKKASLTGKNKQEAASPAGKAVEDQSLGRVGKDDAAKAPAGGMGVAPKGRCVSGRDWKARNQSQK